MQNDTFNERPFLSAANLVTVGAVSFLCTCFAFTGLHPDYHSMGSETYSTERYALSSLQDTLTLASAWRPQATTDSSEESLAALESSIFGSSTVRDIKPAHHDEHVRFVSHLIHTHKAKKHEAESLAHAIVSESTKAKYDPLFVAAVIYAESMFKHSAVSHRGAQGLMQIMPETGRYVSARENIAWRGVGSLKDPRTNLRLGIAYLKYLDAKFKGNRERMLIAYNWGPANLDNALKGKGRAPSESVGYARKIISTHRKWKNEFVQLAALGDRRFIG